MKSPKVTDSSGWRAPRPSLWHRLMYPALGILALIATAAATLVLTRHPAPPPPAAPPPTPTAHALSALEVVGINTLLEAQRTGAHKASGTITVNGHTFGIQLSYTDDLAAGTGAVTAGGTRGDALLDSGVTYLRGDVRFWTALGVTGPVPPEPGWVNIGSSFLDGKLFYPPVKWTTALAPTAEARLDGDNYTVGKASAKIGPSGITHYSVADVKVNVTAIPVNAVTDIAAPLNAERGPVLDLARTTVAGRWALPGPPAEPEHQASPTSTASAPTSSAASAPAP